MSPYYPAFLDLRGRRCLVVGGGEVGQRKAEALVECGARVAVVSPRVTPALAALAAAGRLVHHARPFVARDLRGCTLAIAATGIAAVDGAVAVLARRRRVAVNVVDRPAHCDFIVPSVLRRGALQIAVSTGGRSPALAREIRRRLEPLFPADYASFVEGVGAARARARAGQATLAARMAAAERVVADLLAPRRPAGGRERGAGARGGAPPPRRRGLAGGPASPKSPKHRTSVPGTRLAGMPRTEVLS